MPSMISSFFFLYISISIQVGTTVIPLEIID